jgi:hypothetical protein
MRKRGSPYGLILLIAEWITDVDRNCLSGWLKTGAGSWKFAILIAICT